jgi:predicted NUDIX family phosphoesterase
MSRDAVESDPRVKQVIPYTLVRHEGRYLSYQRAGLGQERRLWGRHSVGIGGHVTVVDGQFGVSGSAQDIVRNAAERELQEEIHVGLPALRSIGLLNDDSDPVGAVHFGVVFLADASGPDVQPREPALTVDMSYLDCETLRSRVRFYEPWSQLLINALPLT